MTYAFLTTMDFRIDAKGKTPKQAYKKAIETYKNIIKNDEYSAIKFFGQLTTYYHKYRRDGTYSVYDQLYSL